MMLLIKVLDLHIQYVLSPTEYLITNIFMIYCTDSKNVQVE